MSVPTKLLFRVVQSLELKEPQAEWKVVRGKWQEELNSYGVVDRDNNIGRIPISEAMKIVAEKGIRPVKAQNSNQQQQKSGQMPSAQQPSDSSSGRQPEQKQP